LATSPDAARLIRIRQFHPKPEAESRGAAGFAAQFDLSRQIKIAGVARRICTAQLQGDRARTELPIDAEEVLDHASSLDLDV
jgi:hypothetical protein